MFNSSSENPAAAVTTLARIIQIGGCILSGIILFVGVIIAVDSYYPDVVIISSFIISILLIAGTYITALILNLFASIADNTSGCASSLRTCKYLLEELTDAKNKKIQNTASSSKPIPQQITPPVQQSRPMRTWTCSHCGKENLDCDNICNNCGQKKVD